MPFAILTRGGNMIDRAVQALGNGDANPWQLVKYIEGMERQGERRGAEMVATLMRTAQCAEADAHDTGKLRDMATARQALEAYVKQLEVKAGNHRSIESKRRPDGGVGFTVGLTRHRKYRVAITAKRYGRGEHLGVYDTREEAHAVGVKTVAERERALQGGVG